MKPYRIRLFAASAVQLFEDTLELQYADARVVVTDWIDRGRTDSQPHLGILLDVYLSAPRILDAIDKSGLAAQLAIEQLSAAHAAAVADPVPWIAFDVDPSNPDREMAQILKDVPRLARPRRRIRPNAIVALLESINQSRGTIDTWRIGRALHHLRKAVLEPDVLDQFEDLWAGLELLNPLLKKAYDLPTGYPGTPCGACGAPIKVPGGSQGIKHAVVTLAGETRQLWSELRNVRQEIAHGAGDVSQRAERLEYFNSVLRRALALALCELLQIQDELRESFSRVPLRLSSEVEFVVTAELVGYSVDALIASEQLPHFEITDLKSTLTSGSAGPASRTEHSSLTLQIRDFTGEYRAVQVRGMLDRDPLDENATFKVSGRVPKREDTDL